MNISNWELVHFFFFHVEGHTTSQSQLFKNPKFDKAVHPVLQPNTRKNIVHGFAKLWEIGWDTALLVLLSTFK
jgi:hypothetical protein